MVTLTTGCWSSRHSVASTASVTGPSGQVRPPVETIHLPPVSAAASTRSYLQASGAPALELITESRPLSTSVTLQTCGRTQAALDQLFKSNGTLPQVVDQIPDQVLAQAIDAVMALDTDILTDCRERIDTKANTDQLTYVLALVDRRPEQLRIP